MLNKAMLIGHLGDDVKIHYFEGGGCVARFPVATTENWTDKQTGEKKSHTEWHTVTVQGKIAENCEKYLSKGSKVYVEGKMKTRKWTDQNGVDKYTTEVSARTVQFLSSKSQNELNQSPVDAYHQKQQGNQPATPQPQQSPPDDDDLPF